MSGKIFNTSDLSFFQKVSAIAFTNPFDNYRDKLFKEISEDYSFQSSDKNRQNAYLKVLSKLDILKQQNKANLKNFLGDELFIIKYVFLFEIYHKYLDEFDALILEQNKIENSVNVKFADNLTGDLLKRGFKQSEAIIYLAFFYQYRRAFYFIDRGIIGNSKCMIQYRRSLWNNVFTCDISLYEKTLFNQMDDFSTLFLGETGSGKGAGASAVGKSRFIPYDKTNNKFKESFSKSFVEINLSEFPETLIESALFGHKKGAFTGAISDNNGIFDKCSSFGSIFLDEIGDLSIPIQIKLLNVLQGRFYSPVGSHEKRIFSGRIIAATNQSLTKLRRENKFRNDFFYRLCSDIINVPSLRERINENTLELEELINHCVIKITKDRNSTLVTKVLDVIHTQLPKEYLWPGNVRELEQCIRRIIINGSYKGDDIFAEIDKNSDFYSLFESGNLKAMDVLAGYCSFIYKKFGTYDEVSKRSGLDRRTVKKYIKNFRS